MQAEVFLTASAVEPADVQGRTVIVVDVLRTSTTIAVALANGARAVIPVPDMAEAGKMAANLDAELTLLGGERDGQVIEGYHLGNSPREYTRSSVVDRTIVLMTTNGTGAIVRSAEATDVVVGGFVNAQAVADFVRRLGRDVVIICGGWKNRIALEDTLCAGLLLDLLWEDGSPDRETDAAHIALAQYRYDREGLESRIFGCNHAERLRRLGLGEDVAICSSVDSVPVVPVYRDNQIVLADSTSGD